MKEFKNILLINFGGIGDEILFLPVINALRKTYPASRITLCLEERSKSFVNLTNLLDDFFCINIKTKNKYIELIKLYFKALSGGYDLIISSGGNSLISVLLFLTGIKTKIGYKTSKLSEKLLTYPVNLNKSQYASKMYFDLVKPVTDLDFELPVINIDEVQKVKNSVLIHPGVSLVSVSKSITKTFSAEVWADIIKRLLKSGKSVYLAGGSDDEKCISAIRKELQDADLADFHDMYGRTENICDLARLIKQSEVMICADSAPMHIGVALNTRIIAVFGPTDDKKLLPESDKFTAVCNNSPCRPCLWDKRQSACDDLKCLEISPEDVIKDIVII